jgi:hypothetical protein
VNRGRHHEHEWIESAPGTALGEPVAYCRCGIYRTSPDPVEFGFGGDSRSAFEVYKSRHSTATAQVVLDDGCIDGHSPSRIGCSFREDMDL